MKSHATIILYTGNVYIADTGNQRIRFVSATTGIISTIAGDGNEGYNGDGIAATSASLYYPLGVALDSSGRRDQHLLMIMLVVLLLLSCHNHANLLSLFIQVTCTSQT